MSGVSREARATLFAARAGARRAAARRQDPRRLERPDDRGARARAAVFAAPDFLDAARAAFAFVWNNLRDADGRLVHSCARGRDRRGRHARRLRRARPRRARAVRGDGRARLSRGRDARRRARRRRCSARPTAGFTSPPSTPRTRPRCARASPRRRDAVGRRPDGGGFRAAVPSHRRRRAGATRPSG